MNDDMDRELLEKMYCDLLVMFSTRDLQYVDALFTRSIFKLCRFYCNNVRRIKEMEVKEDGC